MEDKHGAIWMIVYMSTNGMIIHIIHTRSIYVEH